MSFLVFCSTLFSTIVSISFAVVPIITYCFPETNFKEVTIPCMGKQSLSYIIAVAFSLFVLISWIITGHWLLNNIIGISFVIFTISIVKLPSLIVGFIALMCLFFYDIFWVFFSEGIFGANVMVQVASTAAQNPAKTIASKLGIEVVKQIHLPMKVIWGYHMLGLGDMVVPGFLVAYSLKFDYHKFSTCNSECSHITWKQTYFVPVVIGYALGLLLSLLAVVVFRVAQPALLYLVPCTLSPLIILGKARKELGFLWSGIPFEKGNKENPV